MKRIIWITLFLLLIASYSQGDILPPNSHPLDRQIYITNLSDYPQVSLIGYITGPMIPDYEIQVIEADVSLSKGYKFNTFKVFAIYHQIIEDAGGIDNIELDKIAQTKPPADIIDPYGGFVTNDNPLAAQYYYYRITEVTDSTLRLSLHRAIYKYNNDSPDKIVNYWIRCV